MRSSYESAELRKGSSKLQGRLHNLLRAVKEEADSYAELREKSERKREDRAKKRAAVGAEYRDRGM